MIGAAEPRRQEEEGQGQVAPGLGEDPVGRSTAGAVVGPAVVAEAAACLERIGRARAVGMAPEIGVQVGAEGELLLGRGEAVAVGSAGASMVRMKEPRAGS